MIVQDLLPSGYIDNNNRELRPTKPRTHIARVDSHSERSSLEQCILLLSLTIILVPLHPLVTARGSKQLPVASIAHSIEPARP